jgi:hypothetical protein
MRSLPFSAFSWFLVAMLGTTVGANAGPIASMRSIAPAAGYSVRGTSLQAGGHLYIAGTLGSSPYVERFKVANGIPKATPDRTYMGVGWPIAVDVQGNLYASALPNIEMFSPDSKKPARSLTVGAATSLTVDDQGYLYVGGWWGDEEGEYWYVLVYAPGAQGNMRYSQYINIGSCLSQNACGTQGYAGGLAIDVQGNLHVSSIGSSLGVLTFASPTTNPTPAGILTGAGITSPWGLAIGAHNELYVDNPNGPDSFVAAYPASANGTQAPDRTIAIAGAQTFGPGIAAQDGRLFVADTAGNAVYEVRAKKGGTQKPIATLSAPAPLDVKFGR